MFRLIIYNSKFFIGTEEILGYHRLHRFEMSGSDGDADDQSNEERITTTVSAMVERPTIGGCRISFIFNKRQIFHDLSLE